MHHLSVRIGVLGEVVGLGKVVRGVQRCIKGQVERQKERKY